MINFNILKNNIQYTSSLSLLNSHVYQKAKALIMVMDSLESQTPDWTFIFKK